MRFEVARNEEEMNKHKTAQERTKEKKRRNKKENTSFLFFNLFPSFLLLFVLLVRASDLSNISNEAEEEEDEEEEEKKTRRRRRRRKQENKERQPKAKDMDAGRVKPEGAESKQHLRVHGGAPSGRHCTAAARWPSCVVWDKMGGWSRRQVIYGGLYF